MALKKKPVTDSARLLPRLTLAFFKRPRLVALLWVALTLFGIVSYTTLLRREGFPSISIPVVIVSGSYAVDNAATVDSQVGKPLSDIALKQPGADSVSATSAPNFFSVAVQYKEGTDTDTAKRQLEQAVMSQAQIPAAAKLTYAAPIFGVTGGSTDKIDATISVYGDDSLSLQDLTGQAGQLVDYLQAHKPAQVASFKLNQPFTGLSTGQSVQTSFDRYGSRQDGSNTFHQSVIINVAAVNNPDVIKLENQLHQLLGQAAKQPVSQDLHTAVSASYAPSIKDEISELQRVLLEGLLAVLVIGSIIIAVRASLITVLSMVTVIAITIGFVYLFGYTLNVITLFALILGLSLIVDDTIIMVEAIDSARRKTTDKRQAVAEATTRISRAMTAATLTAVLSFTPLLFVSGVLGNFIRAIPVTIIAALLISLFVALLFIPLFARVLLLGRKQMGRHVQTGVMPRAEHRIASFITRPMLWARHHRRREFAVGISAILVGLAFIGYGVFVFQKVDFNIFPPSKDTNEIAVALTFQPGTTVGQAAAIAARADDITSQTLGENLVSASYYGAANERTASLAVELKPYGQRELSSGQLVTNLEQSFKGFSGAAVNPYQVDVGPPASSFVVNITADNRKQAIALATDMAQYLKGRELKRPNGTTATISKTAISNTGIYERTDGRAILSVSADFDAKDTSTLVTVAQNLVTDRYTPDFLQGYNLSKDAVSFDLGQESENQDSFKTLLYAFPVVLLAIYVLLILQFKSLLQPLIIFMALPFSLFGIANGLYYTHNPFSFFAALGFFALIGLSIKNTILLTDYANQARRAGLPVVDAVAEALHERFRPLVATSLTAVVSLIPLAVTSPFWESLAVTLIFGLLSSTLLVILVFPYFYLGAEYLRLKIRRSRFLVWIILSIAAGVAGGLLIGAEAAVIAVGMVQAIYVVLATTLSVRKRLA